MRRRAFVGGMILGLSCVVGVGCNPFAVEACTLIGCSNGLTVELSGPLEYPFTLTVSADGDSRSAECTVANPCTGARFEDFTPARATVVYASATRRVERTVLPDYRRWRPNGDHCDPECLTATIELDLAS